MRKIILACLAAIFSLPFINAQNVAVKEAAKPAQQVAAAPQEEPALAEEVVLAEDTVIPIKTRNLLLGATLGINMTTYSSSEDYLSATYGLGGQIGINCDVPIGGNFLRGYFSINPELIFAYKTVGLEEKYDGASFKSTDRIYSMNVPVHLKWNKSVGSGFFVLAAGPMLNVGLGGTNKWEKGEVIKVGIDADGNDINRTIDRMLLFQADPENMAVEWNRDHALYNVLAFALNFKIGFDFGCGFSIAAGYQMGLSNMINKAPYDEWNKNVDTWNQELKAELDKMVKEQAITPQERDARYKNEQELKLEIPSQKSSSIFLTIGYVF